MPAAAPATQTTRANLVTMRGKPVTLEGRPVKPGDQAPDFTALATDMSPKRLADFRGKTVVLTTIPSLDTPVCDLETRTFNTRAAELPNAVVLVVSMDLPFAMKRWCGANNATNVLPLSDFRDREVGSSYGVRMKESGLLARAVFVIDPKGTVRYEEIVPDVSKEPDYDKALAAAKSAG